MALEQLNTTELDFDKIKANIKNHFLRQDSVYKDWNFDGSSLNMLLDVLAYNTHYNAVLAHMAINESFIDSAQIRKNVVSHAKLVGYTPRSAKSSRANIEVEIPGINTLDSLTLPRGQKFTTVLDEVTYTFVTAADYTAAKNISSNKYEFTNADGGTDNSIEIFEGTLQVSSYSVNNSLVTQKFVIDEVNADMSSLLVRVREHLNSDKYIVYSIYGSAQYKTLEDLDSTSLVFFLSENIYGRYEVSFGNGIYGALPGNLNIVELEYITTLGAAANFANSFSIVDAGTVTKVLSAASGGGEREGIESIRFNAPISIITQNRAVTADDYRSMILREFADIQTLNIWGGEDANPPEYGKVFITIKPKAADQLTPQQKDKIITLLSGKKVLTVTPVFLDVDFTYIYLDVYFKFNANLTKYGKSELESIVRTSIKNFNTTELQEFDNVFRYSKLLNTIDKSNSAILNSFAEVYLYKKIYLYAGEPESIILSFNAAPEISNVSSLNVLSTDAFTFNGESIIILDEVNPENAYIRNMYMSTMRNGLNFRINVTCGQFNILTSTISLNPISVDEDTEIRIYMKPKVYDLAPLRQQLLTIDYDTTTVLGNADSIAVAGSAGIASYSTYKQ